MSKEVIIYLTIGIYILVIVTIGIVNSKSSKSIEDFTVGKRNAGAWLTALSYGTAYFSAVMFIGYAGGAGWAYGLWGILPGIGNAIIGSLFAWLVLARKTREITGRQKIKSMPQLFEKRFLSRNMKLFSAVVIFIFLTPYSASVYKGLTSVCSVVLGIDDRLCMIIIAIASAVLLITGGYVATLKADFVQGIIMVGGVIILIVFVVISPSVGGITNGLGDMVDYMTKNNLNPLPLSGFISLMAMVFMTSFGTWGLPQMIHKYYGIKDNKEIGRATIISTVFALLVAGGGYFIGSLAHLFFQNTMPAGGKDFIVPNILIMSNLPDIILGIVLVLLISASVSTLASITLTACSTVAMDLINDVKKVKITPQKLSVVTKLLCIVFVLFSYLIANYPTPILEMMSYSWGIISGSFLAPYLLTLYWKGINRFGAWCGMLGGFTCALVPVSLSGFKTPDGPLFACIAMIASFILCFAGSYIGSKLNLNSGKHNDIFYTQVLENE